MKKTGIIIGVVVAVLALYSCQKYNGMVAAEEGVKEAWSQVENVYQRRMDLIPNLVATVKGYAKHEEDVFTKVTEARSKAGGVLQVSDEVLNNPESFERFQKAQGELSSALQRLLSVAENYPELKANENFMALQSQLEGTENRITQERRKYNEVCTSYNTLIRVFPGVLLANMFGFRPKPHFAAQEGAETAPKVQF